MSKRDLNQKVLKIDGTDFPTPMDLKTACFLSVTGTIQGDESLTAEKKLSMYNLAKKVSPGGVVDFTVEELAMLKERAGKMFIVEMMGRFFEMIEAEPAAAATPASSVVVI